MSPRVTRRRLMQQSAALAFAGLALPAVARAQQATPVAGAGADWPFYGRDLSGAKASDQGPITAANVASLGQLWQVDVGGPVSATPVIAGGVAYTGSYDGRLYAIDVATGASVWTYETGAAVLEPNLQIPLGITGSAAVDGGTVYVGDAAASIHAVDAATGQARWTTKVDNQPNASIWSSPVVAGSTLYVGVASVAKQVGFRGSVVALNAETGTVLWQTYMVPEGADGAGVFAVPAIDEGRKRLYVGTQNAYSANPAPFGHPISIVALDLATGDITWSFAAPPNDDKTAPVDDVAFSASPNLFTVEIDGQQRDLVGEGQKSGDYWALDRDSGEVVWQTKVSPAGFLGGMEGTSAVLNVVIAVPATNWLDPNGPGTGLVTALNAGTGATIWSNPQKSPAASPAAIENDVVFHAGLDGILHAYGLTDGAEIVQTDLGASVSGGIAVAEGFVVLGVGTPQFAPFIRPGNTIRAFAPGANTGTPTPATPVASSELA
jgi:polyvinyl alcohol dehydrogenase (cytochrome)